VDAAQGGWVNEFSAGACPAENDLIFFFRLWRKNRKKPQVFPGPFSRACKARKLGKYMI